jgi:hypothetical protein
VGQKEPLPVLSGFGCDAEVFERCSVTASSRLYSNIESLANSALFFCEWGSSSNPVVWDVIGSRRSPFFVWHPAEMGDTRFQNVDPTAMVTPGAAQVVECRQVDLDRVAAAPSWSGKARLGVTICPSCFRPWRP